MTKDQVIAMEKKEFVQWLKPFKHMLPSYIAMSLKYDISRGTVINVVTGVSKNESGRAAIYDEIQDCIARVKKASII